MSKTDHITVNNQEEQIELVHAVHFQSISD